MRCRCGQNFSWRVAGGEAPVANRRRNNGFAQILRRLPAPLFAVVVVAGTPVAAASAIVLGVCGGVFACARLLGGRQGSMRYSGAAVVVTLVTGCISAPTVALAACALLGSCGGLAWILGALMHRVRA